MLKVEVIGNLAADVEVKESNGSKFATFRVADTQKFKGQDGQDKEVTNWIDCTFSNVESKVLQYLKTGVKVFVRGNASLRVYSSKKDRCMKAGLQVNVTEVELCGGNNDEVPRQVVDPENGQLFDVEKYYWTNAPTKGMKKEDLKDMIDVRGNRYKMNCRGFVVRIPENNEEQSETDSNASQA